MKSFLRESRASASSITNGGIGAAPRYVLPTTVVEDDAYYSLVLRVDSVGAAFTSETSYFAAFVNPDPKTYEARLGARTNAVPGQYNLGITKVSSSAGVPVWANADFVEGETHFVVVRYRFNPGTSTDDEVELWIDPAPATFGTETPPSSTCTAALSGTDIAVISQFTFRQNTAANTPAAMTFDELRVGTTWASVTPPVRLQLSIQHSGTAATLHWPTNAPGLVLETTPTLSQPTWTAVTNSAVISGTNLAVTVGATNASRFFRLRR